MNALDLFRLVANAREERGWGRSLRRTVADWYTRRPAFDVAAEILKRPAYGGWTHRDLLRLAHPTPPTPAHNALFQWAADGELGHLATADLLTGELRQVHAYERLKRTADEREAADLVERYSLTHEMAPASWRSSPALWETLLASMSCAEIVACLGELADCGLLAEEGPTAALVVARLIDRRGVRQSGLNAEEIAECRRRYAAHRRALPVVLDALDMAAGLAG